VDDCCPAEELHTESGLFGQSTAVATPLIVVVESQIGIGVGRRLPETSGRAPGSSPPFDDGCEDRFIEVNGVDTPRSLPDDLMSGSPIVTTPEKLRGPEDAHPDY
jgi:hypothetical protein